MRVTTTGPGAKEREQLLAHYRKRLAAFQRIPANRRKAECAEEGEAICSAMIAELERQQAHVAPPAHAPDHPDYLLDCEFAMEPAFMEMVQAAERAGWDPTHVARAAKSLGTNHMLGREANRETDEQIKLKLKWARRRRRRRPF